MEFKKVPVGDIQIPETSDIRALPLELSDAQLEHMTIVIWHQYILHDEITAALRFIQDAPYQIKHSPKILEAIKITKKMSEHMDSIEEDKSVNTAKTADSVPFEDELVSFEDVESAKRNLRFSWVF
jgi:tRNA G10  N-methylase Trm11